MGIVYQGGGGGVSAQSRKVVQAGCMMGLVGQISKVSRQFLSKLHDFFTNLHDFQALNLSWNPFSR